jgi:hypothetical protein
MHCLQRATKENIPTSLFETIHSFRINQTYSTHSTGIIYAQITEQNSYTPTNIEQEPDANQPYQQTSGIQDVKKYDGKPV